MTEDLVRPTIPIAYLADLGVRSPRSAVREALEAASLAPRVLSSRRLRVSILQFSRFYGTLVRALDDEVCGLLAKPVPRGSYATLVRLLASSDDLASALDGASRFYGLFDGTRRILALTIDRTTATLSLETRDRERARSIFFVHAFLLSAWRTAAWLVGRAVPLDAVVLPSRFTRFRGETRYLFGREPSFEPARNGAQARLVFRAADARLPIVRRPGEAGAWAAGALRDILLGPPRSNVETELRALLAAATPIADVPLDVVTRRLGLSRASLARELARLGTSFLRVKDDLRRDHAIALLTETTFDLAEIGRRLGYSGARAFQRAFRQWTGATAGTFRQRAGLSPRLRRASAATS